MIKMNDMGANRSIRLDEQNLSDGLLAPRLESSRHLASGGFFSSRG
jgi:hypothetical protein